MEQTQNEYAGKDINSFESEAMLMKDQNCVYCMSGELLDAFGIYICDLSVSTLILFKEQSHPGRCIVADKDHVSELVDISEEERNAFFADVARAAKAIHRAFRQGELRRLRRWRQSSPLPSGPQV